jgi:cytochrome c oxidase cbb3-type subunit 3
MHLKYLVSAAVFAAFVAVVSVDRPASAQGAPAGQAPAQSASAGQAPTTAPAPAGRGAGQRGTVPPGGRGQRRGGFTQYTRPIASQDVIVRGQAVYETNCASCHAVDLRGTVDGKNPNLLRSGVALRDQHGELIGARLTRHASPLTLSAADTTAVAEYIHSVHATMGGQGSPPGRNPTNVTLNVLVGDPKAGEDTFRAMCGTCHSADGNLKGIGSRFPDPRTLQNSWVSGSAAGGGGRGGGGGGALPATVTLADGSTLEGTLLREDDFLVVLVLPDGTRKSMARTNGVPRVEVKDPRAGHVNTIVKLAHDDKQSKMMHDITAYLWSLK